MARSKHGGASTVLGILHTIILFLMLYKQKAKEKTEISEYRTTNMLLSIKKKSHLWGLKY